MEVRRSLARRLAATFVLAHVHTNATFTDPGPAATRLRKPASHLHIPTGRVPLEFVLWHLVAEWGVTPKTDAWRELLVDSLEGFERRRRAP